LENDYGVSQKRRFDVIVSSLKSQSEPQAVLESIWQGIIMAKDEHHYDDDMTLLVIKLTSLKAAA
jgi:serine phosphatase RsbU (regulator of sigma subunit)